eukprot:jgi/Mesvir1/15275/Mv06493-RA.1
MRGDDATQCADFCIGTMNVHNENLVESHQGRSGTCLTFQVTCCFAIVDMWKHEPLNADARHPETRTFNRFLAATPCRDAPWSAAPGVRREPHGSKPPINQNKPVPSGMISQPRDSRPPEGQGPPTGPPGANNESTQLLLPPALPAATFGTPADRPSRCHPSSSSVGDPLLPGAGPGGRGQGPQGPDRHLPQGSLDGDQVEPEPTAGGLARQLLGTLRKLSLPGGSLSGQTHGSCSYERLLGNEAVADALLAGGGGREGLTRPAAEDSGAEFDPVGGGHVGPPHQGGGRKHSLDAGLGGRGYRSVATRMGAAGFDRYGRQVSLGHVTGADARDAVNTLHLPAWSKAAAKAAATNVWSNLAKAGADGSSDSSPGGYPGTLGGTAGPLRVNTWMDGGSDKGATGGAARGKKKRKGAVVRFNLKEEGAFHRVLARLHTIHPTSPARPAFPHAGAAHWVGCLYYLLARLNGFNRSTWIGQWERIGRTGYEEDTADNLEKYVLIIYKGFNAVSNLGFEIIVHTEWVEMLASIIVIFLQVVLYSYILGTIFHYLVKKDPHEEAHRMRMRAVDHYCHTRQLPQRLRDSVSRYFEFQYHKNGEQHASVVKGLPSTILTRVARFQYQQLLSKASFLFGRCSPQFLGMMMVRLREVGAGVRT